MSTMIWIGIYAMISIVAKWIISWGGAEYIKGWKSIFFFDMSNSEEWSKDQVIMMTWFFWIGLTILFCIGLFHPEYRFYSAKQSLYLAQP